MKKNMFLAAIIFTFSTLSFADVQIIESATLNGTAVKLPNETLQIMNPTITMQNQEYLISFTNETGVVACGMIGKKYVGGSKLTTYGQRSQGILNFSNGAMNVIFDPNNNYNYFNVLTCK